MNVFNLRKGDLEELNKSVKVILRNKGFYERQASEERLYMKRVDGGRGLKSFKEVDDETKVRVARYMAKDKRWPRTRNSGLIDGDYCRLCGEYRETVQYLLGGWVGAKSWL